MATRFVCAGWWLRPRRGNMRFYFADTQTAVGDPTSSDMLMLKDDRAEILTTVKDFIHVTNSNVRAIGNVIMSPTIKPIFV